MYKKHLFLALCSMIIGWGNIQTLSAQVDSTNTSIDTAAVAIDTTFNGQDAVEETVEDIITTAEIEEQVDFTIVTDYLEDLRSDPLNINFASKEQLRILPGLNDIMINNLQDYIAQFGFLTSVYELQAVPGFSVEVIDEILPFIRTDEARREDISPGTQHPAGPGLGEVLANIEHELIHRINFTLEQERGYTDPDTTFRFATNELGDTTQIDTQLSTRYVGSPYRSYSRYRARYGQNVSIAITAEKDAGEEFRWDPENHYYGYDFLSAHIAIQNYGRLKNLVIGDYNLQFGQGMVLSRGLGFGKGAEVINTVKTPPYGIRPYASVNENQFLRGAAAQYAFGNIYLTGFFSRNRLDASVAENAIDTTTSEIAQVTSIPLSGLHRTPSELEKRRTILETMTGGRLAFKNRNLTVGSTFYYQQYNTSLQPTLRSDNQFAFRGDRNYVVGVDYDWIFQNFNFFGEVGRSRSGGMGIITGFMSSLSPTLDFALLYRNFDVDFHSPKGYVFAEVPTALSNERGLYAGVKMKLNPKWTIKTYFDQFYFPWHRFKASFPSKGYEVLTQTEYKPNRNTLVYIRFRSDNREENASLFEEGQKIQYLVNTRKINLRLHFQTNIDRNISIKTRAEAAWFTKGETDNHQGLLLYQDLSWKFGYNFKVTGRYALFDIPDYSARIYAYENDVLGSFTIPPYFRTGSRYYLVFNYKATRWLEFWLRFAQTRLHKAFLVDGEGNSFLPESNTGIVNTSSLESIMGNEESEIKFQVRLRF